MQYQVIRKHVLEPSKLHGALDSLQRQVEELTREGWKPHSGLSKFNDYIMQIMIKEDDKDNG
jgi:hypothetical protein